MSPAEQSSASTELGLGCGHTALVRQDPEELRA